MKRFIFIIFCLVFFLTAAKGAFAANYYMSPSGKDTNTGQSESSPVATFSKALQLFSQHRDSSGKATEPITLYLMDGTYFQAFHPTNIEGTASNRITVKALNDGKAVIDGDTNGDGKGDLSPVSLDVAGGNEYFVFEGLVAKNSNLHIYNFANGASNIELRRVSGYNADKDGNAMVFKFGLTSKILLEDCVAAGTGRKMILNYQGNGNTIRRCFTDWHRWDGLNFHDEWPWGENIDVYNASNMVIENSIGYGRVPRYSFTVRSNDADVTTANNKNYGNIATKAGIYPDGRFVDWTQKPAGKTEFIDVYGRTGYRVGFEVFAYAGGTVTGTLYQDILSVNNAGHGFFNSYQRLPKPINTKIANATIVNNGLDSRSIAGGVGTGAIWDPGQDEEISEINITDSQITGLRTLKGVSKPDIVGTGARLTHRYVNGQLTQEPLWPWPMEDRIKNEYAQVFGINNFSVTCEIGKLINQYTKTPISYINVQSYCSPTAPTVSIPTTLPVSTAPTTPPLSGTTKPGDANSDSKVDGIDYVVWLNNYNKNVTGTSLGDFNNNSFVDGVDYVIWLNNYGK